MVNTLDSLLHFTSITLSLNITGLTSREPLARAIRSSVIVYVPRPLRSSTLLRIRTSTIRWAFARQAANLHEQNK